MKDDNILLEALKEIKGMELGSYQDAEMWRIAHDALLKYNQSPSDESNQDELWKSVLNEINTLEKEGIWDKMYYKDMMNKLKSQYKITKREETKK